MVGIYEIVHLASGRTYIGSSDNVVLRLKAHHYMLRVGRHDNIHLQRAWTKYGAEAFVFRRREECTLDRLREREAEVLSGLPRRLRYNISPVVRRGARAGNCSMSDRTARAIYRRAGKGETALALAAHFKIPLHAVRRVMFGRTYRHITKGIPARAPQPARGIRIGLNKLSPRDVDRIRARLSAGDLGFHIARDFNVTPANIYAIRDRRTWKHQGAVAAAAAPAPSMLEAPASSSS